MSGRRTPGKRVEDVVDPRQPHPRLGPGEYRRTVHPTEGTVWECRPPGQPESVQGNLAHHQVEEHEDGTITVSPSLLIETTWQGEPITWHGFLRAGIWEEA